MSLKIDFHGVKYKTGAKEGYRPSPDATQTRKDLEVCEQVVTYAGLPMSPEELLRAIEATMTLVPKFVSADGIEREFSGLMRWYRSFSGKLAAAGSPWNDTCSCVVKLKTLKNTKLGVNASFSNSMASLTPKLNNVTWIGATLAENVVRINDSFGAYGRHMQFDASLGDTAKLVVGGAEHALTCTASDVAHAVFAWPAGVVCEEGTTATFVMKSHGADPAGALVTQTKRVMVAAPLDNLELGKVKLVDGSKPDNTLVLDEVGQPPHQFEMHLNKNILNFSQPTTIVKMRRYVGGELMEEADLTPYKGGAVGDKTYAMAGAFYAGPDPSVWLNADTAIFIQAEEGTSEKAVTFVAS